MIEAIFGLANAQQRAVVLCFFYGPLQGLSTSYKGRLAPRSLVAIIQDGGSYDGQW